MTLLKVIGRHIAWAVYNLAECPNRKIRRLLGVG
jgi:hypothetical protein